jgi:GNAT superfamily N-acetyltransferase
VNRMDSAASATVTGRIEVRVIPASATWPLRLAVLRPGRPLESAQFPGDDAPTTRHFGAFEDGRLAGIASLYAAELPDRPGVTALQLRGMATAPEVRGRGLGRVLVQACIAFARESGAHLLWCNARTGAIEFYRKLGFAVVGEEFQIADVGPHFRMWRAVGKTVPA